MARFILDIANVEDIHGLMKDLLEYTFLADKVTSITCIEKTNANQFDNSGTDNVLSQEQIDSYNNRTSE